MIVSIRCGASCHRSGDRGFPICRGPTTRIFRNLAKTLGEKLGIELSEGVYAAVAGPSYETPAEVQMLGTLGADLVGMSTVLEVIAAKQMGLRCLCLSLVTNLGSGVVDEPMDHDDVLKMSRASAGKIERLVSALLSEDGLL